MTFEEWYKIAEKRMYERASSKNPIGRYLMTTKEIAQEAWEAAYNIGHKDGYKVGWEEHSWDEAERRSME